MNLVEWVSEFALTRFIMTGISKFWNFECHNNRRRVNHFFIFEFILYLVISLGKLFQHEVYDNFPNSKFEIFEFFQKGNFRNFPNKILEIGNFEFTELEVFEIF